MQKKLIEKNNTLHIRKNGGTLWKESLADYQ